MYTRVPVSDHSSSSHAGYQHMTAAESPLLCCLLAASMFLVSALLRECSLYTFFYPKDDIPTHSQASYTPLRVHQSVELE